MSEQSNRDRIIDEVVSKVEQHPSFEADHAVIHDKAADAVDELLDQPVQTFVPLLAENTVVSGLHRDRAKEGGGS